MKKYFLSALLLVIVFQINGQELYNRAKINLENKDISILAGLGVEVDHGHLALGRYLENDFSESEIKLIRNAGFEVEIIIEDVSSYYENQLQDGVNKIITEDCFGDDTFSAFETPANFTLGSMGGFYTYDEVLAILDDMQEKFPDIISVKKQIGNIETHEGRPIYAVVISDNPETTEDEPKSLYNAIHHAREPNGLTQLIFFMWHLLENYGTDDLVTEMVNELELHFIPVVNPDGYIYNETIAPNGGGLWRKNRRDNGDGTIGVDLNRNYGFEWGINDIGSSPNTASDVYRGPSAFSEPETQAVKQYCETYPFNFILNYHCFGNLLIYPWGYNDAPTPESDYFQAIAVELTKFNGYNYGTGIETVGYNVNGASDDWMYGEETTKQKSYSMTPEVGTEGFWPPIDAIVPNCQANMHANLALASFNLNYPVLSTDAPIFVDQSNGLITYTVGQLGLEGEEFTVTAEAISDNVMIEESTMYNLLSLESQQKTVDFVVDSETPLGAEIVMVFKMNTNTPGSTDTVRFTYLENGVSEAIVEEVFGDDQFWTADGVDWFYDDQVFVSPEVSFSDSEGNYENNVTKLAISKSIELPEAEQLILSYDLLVDTEKAYDFAVIYIHEQDEIAIPLCGKYSVKGNEDQYPDIPLYDGSFGWVKEEIDISEWKGKVVRFNIEFVSDGFVNEDGIHIDDWSISAINEFVAVKEVGLNDISIMPNPASHIIRIDMPYNRIDQVWIVNMLGEKVSSEIRNENTIDVQHLSAGMYQLLLVDKEGNNYVSSFIKL